MIVRGHYGLKSLDATGDLLALLQVGTAVDLIDLHRLVDSVKLAIDGEDQKLAADALAVFGAIDLLAVLCAVDSAVDNMLGISVADQLDVDIPAGLPIRILQVAQLKGQSATAKEDAMVLRVGIAADAKVGVFRVFDIVSDLLGPLDSLGQSVIEHVHVDTGDTPVARQLHQVLEPALSGEGVDLVVRDTVGDDADVLHDGPLLLGQLGQLGAQLLVLLVQLEEVVLVDPMDDVALDAAQQQADSHHNGQDGETGVVVLLHELFSPFYLW